MKKINKSHFYTQMNNEYESDPELQSILMVYPFPVNSLITKDRDEVWTKQGQNHNSKFVE